MNDLIFYFDTPVLINVYKHLENDIQSFLNLGSVNKAMRKRFGVFFEHFFLINYAKLNKYKKNHEVMMRMNEFDKTNKKTSSLIHDDLLKAENVLFVFNYNRSQRLEPKLDASITRIEFGPKFNQRIHDVVFPPNLTHLTFGHSFNKPLTSSVIIDDDCFETKSKFAKEVEFPKSLTHLVFGNNFNQPLNASTLTLINRMKHSNYTNTKTRESKSFVFPPNLTHLEFGYKFNQMVDGVNFPPNLTHLEFGNWFNKSLDGAIFPPNLTHIKVGYQFNQSLDNVTFPPNLTHIKLRKSSLKHILY